MSQKSPSKWSSMPSENPATNNTVLALGKVSLAMLGMMNLKGAYFDEDSFIPVAQTMMHFTQQLEALDLGENPMLSDQVSGKFIQSIVELSHKLKIFKQNQLLKRRVERVGLSNKSLLSITRALRHTCIQQVDFSNNQQIRSSFFSELAFLLQKGSFPQLQVLYLSNTKLQDKQGIQLVDIVLQSPTIKEVDFSRNLLGFRFGSHLITRLISGRKVGSLKLLDLSYNNLSYLVMNSINRLLDKVTNNRTISQEEKHKYKIEKIIQEAPGESESLNNSLDLAPYHSSRRVKSRSKSRSKDSYCQSQFLKEDRGFESRNSFNSTKKLASWKSVDRPLRKDKQKENERPLHKFENDVPKKVISLEKVAKNKKPERIVADDFPRDLPQFGVESQPETLMRESEGKKEKSRNPNMGRSKSNNEWAHKAFQDGKINLPRKSLEKNIIKEFPGTLGLREWKRGAFRISSKAVPKQLEDEGWAFSEVKNEDLELELGSNPVYFHTKKLEVKLRRNKSALEL